MSFAPHFPHTPHSSHTPVTNLHVCHPSDRILFTCIWRVGGIGITETGLLASEGHRAFGGIEDHCNRETFAGAEKAFVSKCNARCRVG